MFQNKMEAIITVVGFLGAGKTTLLNHLVSSYISSDWSPFVILNDYENAYLDMQQFKGKLSPDSLWPLNGSCICCSGIMELRDCVNRIPKRKKGITLIEANGTSDACSLMGFLGVGLKERFLPPIQVSVVDTRNWQKRGEHNDLEANQIQVSSLIVLTHYDHLSSERIQLVSEKIKAINPLADIMKMDEIDESLLPKIEPVYTDSKQMDHFKAHWASSSIDLPRLKSERSIQQVCREIPQSILRVKGCTQLGEQQQYTYFERTPDGKISIRPFNGVPQTGPKLITIGPGSEPSVLKNIVDKVVFLKI
tara:strand:+ start:586 stop:1506 length:921 start_codon:yes stop_codon:yes gene_type:complete